MKKIPFARIKNKNSYFTRKLKQGYIIVDVLVSDTENEISLLSVYGNDKKDESCMACMFPEVYRESVFVSQVIPEYPFKNRRCSDDYLCCMELFDAGQGICSFEDAAHILSYLSEKHGEQTSCMDGEEEQGHREFYIIKPNEESPYNMASLGGEFECEFVESWMKSHGYYTEE